MTSPGSANLGTAHGKVQIEYKSDGVAKVTKEIANFQNQLTAVDKQIAGFQKGLASINGSLKINVREISVDRASFNGAVAKWQNSVRLGTITLDANIKIAPREVTIDSSAIDRAMKNFRSNQNLGINSGATVLVRVAVDENQVRQLGIRIRNELGRTIADQQSFGQQAMNNFSAGFRSASPQLHRQAQQQGQSSGGLLAAGMMGALKASPIIAAVGTAVAAVGVVFKKGFDRLEGLDSAAAKLKALGFETQQIQAISKSALESVKGTSFGLDQAFNAAASALAAGVQGGQDLTNFLTSVANNAALAGTSMQDMGDIFNEVAVEGRLTGDVINSLQDRGIDVFGNLSKSMNVTKLAAKEMAENGQVDFAQFRAAMNLNQGAAVTMGQTVSGSMENLWAAVSRVGALLLRPLFGEANGQASKFAQAIKFVTDALGKVEDWLSKNQDKVVGVWGLAGKSVLMFGKAILWVGGEMTKVTQNILKGLTYIASGWEKAGGFLPFGSKIQKGAKEAKDTLEGWSKELDVVNSNLPKMQELLDKGIAGIDKWVENAKKGGSATGDLSNVFKKAKEPAVSLAEALKKFGLKDNEFISGIQGTTTEFNKLIKTLKEKGATNSFLNFIKGIRGEFTNGGSAVKSFSEAIEKLGDASATAEDKASTLIDSLKEMGAIPNDDALQSYTEFIQQLGDAAQNAVDPLSAVGDALVNVDGTLNKAAGANESKLFQTLTEAREKFTQLAASGTVNPDEAYANIQKNLRDALTDPTRFALSDSVANQVIEKYIPKNAIVEAIKNAGDPEAAAKAVFGDKPAELEAILKMMTKQDDLLKQIVPEGVLKIPAEVIAKPISGSSNFIDQAFGISDKIKEILGVDPTARQGKLDGSVHRKIGSDNAPTGTPGNAAGLTPNNLYANPTGIVSSRLGINQDSVNALNDPTTLNNLLNQNQDIKNILGPQVSQAAEQGKNFAEAFAAGIDSASDEVKQAIIRLAGLAGDGLGHSPALYGPLSGKGWTLERGKVFTKAYASGISSASSDVKGAVSSMVASGVMPLSDRMTQAIQDMQEFSDLGKKFFDVGKQIADIAVNTLKFANDMSGGRLFPKHYVKDPNKIQKPSTTTGFNPQLQTPNISALTGGNTPAPTSIAGGQQGTADYIIKKAMSLGYNREQANYFATQAFGESGLAANAFGEKTGDKSGPASGIFQFTPDTAKDVGLTDPNNAQQNIDAYFRLAQQRGLTPQNFTDPTQLGTQVSIGGPYHPDNVGHRQRAEKGVQQFLDAFGGTPSTNNNELIAPLTNPDTSRLSLPTGGDGTKALSLNDRLDVPSLTTNTPPITPSSNGGGNTDAATALDAFAQTLVGATYEMGGFSKAAIDCSGAVSAITNFATGIEPFANRASTVNMGEFLANKGFQVGRGGPGDLRIGWWDKGGGANGHTALTLPSGINAESTTSNGISGFRMGDKAVGADDGQFTNQMFLPGSSLHPGEINTDGLPVNIKGAAPGALNGIDLSAGIPKAIKDNPELMKTFTGQGFSSPEARLQALDSQIADAQRLGTPEGKALSDRLSGIRSSVMDQNGLKEAPSDLETAQSIISGGSGIVSSAFATIDSTIKAIGGAKDLGDTFVRGMKDTSDVNRVIDDFQTFLDLGSKIAQLTSDISGFASSMVGAAGAGDSSGSAQGVAMALGAVSTISGLVSQGFAAANAVIDLGQEVARIAGKYAGRAITSMLGFPGAQDMNFLLDTVTGQLHAYTSENPQDKHTFDTLGRRYNSGRYQDQRQGPSNAFYIYQGPGQDPRDTMNDAMFAVKSSGMGTFGYGQQP